MTIGWPQALLLTFMFLKICGHASKNGQPMGLRFNLGHALIDTALLVGILYWGGFFS